MSYLSQVKFAKGLPVIRYRLRELIADKSFRDNRTVTIGDVAEGTGITRRSLSRIINERGYTTGTDALEKLCRYFECRLEEVAEYVPEEPRPSPKRAATKRSRK